MVKEAIQLAKTNVEQQDQGTTKRFAQPEEMSVRQKDILGD